MTFPTFDGKKDRTLGRTMLEEVNGPNGIRTRISKNADGSTTRLRTRNGMPEFVTLQEEEDGVRVRRGFVAYVRGAKYGALFDPYTLTVLDPKYTLVGALYSVQDFATGWNVSASDTTKWNDTIVFDGQVVKVNAKEMPLINSPRNGSGGAFPFLRKGSAEEPYGNAVLNATQKRIFAVGREAVQSWGGSGRVETLTPTSPRSENKAMTVGPRVASHTAYLGQLFYSGDSWDDLYGEWGFSTAQVSMLLTAPYLTKVSNGDVAAMTPPSIVLTGTDTGPRSTPVTLPSVPVALVSTDARIVQTNTALRVIYWYWNDTFASELQGSEVGPNVRTTYSGNDTDTVHQHGYSIEVHFNTTKTFDVRQITLDVDTQSVYACSPDEIVTYTELLATASATEIIWEDTFHPSRGAYGFTIGSHRISPSGVTAGRNYEEQTGSGYVQLATGEKLVDIQFSRSHSTGGAFDPSPKSGRWDYKMGEASTYPGQAYGMGVTGRLHLGVVVYPASDTIPVFDWYKQNPYPPPNQTAEVLAEIEASYTSKATEYQAQTYRSSENEDGYYITNLYTSTFTASEDRSTTSLTWESRDYLLYDSQNFVYVYVHGVFSGADGIATLHVSLKVTTRYSSNTIALGEFSYNYGSALGMLPEVEIDTGVFAVPSPQIRALFAPLYQEQGSFKGAHYVTAAEEANGALPFHGFNFVLVLQPYDAVSSCNDDNLGTQVFFVPCNLLEMLYAFVFSQEYGVSQYERYPVAFPQRFADMMSSANALFNVPRRVSIRNGVVSNWIDTLGAAYANTPTTELYRT